MYFNFCFSSAWFLLTQVWQECTDMSKANEHLKKMHWISVFFEKLIWNIIFSKVCDKQSFLGSWNRFKRSITSRSALNSKIFLVLPVWCYYINLVKKIWWQCKVQKKPSKVWHNKLKMKIRVRKWKLIGEGVPFLKFHN